MDFAFPWPFSQGEWLAWWSAAATAFIGLFFMFAPRAAMRLLRLQTRPGNPEALAEVRATMSGFHLGIGLCCIVFAQPLVYMALGVSWGLAAFGRIVAMMSDGATTVRDWLFLILALLLAALPLAYAGGFVA